MIYFFKRYALFIGLCLLFLSGGIVIGTLLSSHNVSVIPFQEDRLGGYKYINPLLECDTNQIDLSTEYKPSSQNIQTIIDTEKKKGNVQDVSVYYRDLNNGPWFSINSSSEFAPASLLKVPIMMAYYKAAETDPSILTQHIVYATSANQEAQYYAPTQTLENGKSYTADELIHQMIVYSDNDAMTLLGNHIDQDSIIKILSDLGIEPAKSSSLPDALTVRSYASLFRVLYNASYLSKTYSEKALSLLAQTGFPQGIAAPLPKNMTVADKFGEREFADGTKQLHNCGIIYYPQHPYLLCIMTQGNDYQPLANTIAAISQSIYQNLHQKYH